MFAASGRRVLVEGGDLQIGSDSQHLRQICFECFQAGVCSGGGCVRTFSNTSQKEGCAGGGLSGKRIFARDENSTFAHLQEQPKPSDGLQNSALGYMEGAAS
jgi:hypothetical protein